VGTLVQLRGVYIKPSAPALRLLSLLPFSPPALFSSGRFSFSSPRSLLVEQARSRGSARTRTAKELVASYTLGFYPLSFPVQVVSSGTHPEGKPLTLPAGALNLQSVSLVQRTRDYLQTDRPAPSFRKALNTRSSDREAGASCHVTAKGSPRGKDAYSWLQLHHEGLASGFW